jgi:predicted GH43/DUF377 family glycosyl hydrolase
MSLFQLHRLGQIMEAVPGDPQEAEGVTNPAADVEPLKHYVMTYTAYSRNGPRIALAVSEDRFHWNRLGLATFLPFDGIALDDVEDKDASVFPVAVPNPSGESCLALIHRPLFPGTRPEEKVCDWTTGDIDYGMADSCIGVARLDLPAALPPMSAVDPPLAMV